MSLYSMVRDLYQGHQTNRRTWSNKRQNLLAVCKLVGKESLLGSVLHTCNAAHPIIVTLFDPFYSSGLRMILNKLFSVQVQVLYIVFASLAFAALQNITVDDAVTSGTVVPVYLPAPSDWNQGNACSVCLVKPDPSLAYDGTWHNGRFYPTSNIPLSFAVSFVGSGLYIYFILANTVPNVTTFTNVNFFLDDVLVSSFNHSPSTSTNFEYNQAVFASDSLPYGQHTMTVVPINDSVTSVLMLFDYLVYTTETSSGTNVGAIVGGAVGGVAALLLVITAAICYRRYKRRTAIQAPLPIVNAVEPFVLSHEIARTPSPIQRVQTRPDEPGSRHKQSASLATVPLSTAPSTIGQPPTSNGLSSGSAAEILEQVGMLRNEVSLLRDTRGQGWLGSEPPPGYS